MTGGPTAWDDVLLRTKGNETEIFAYSLFGGSAPTASIAVTAVSRSGVSSGSISGTCTPSTTYGTQDMATQASNNVNVAGGKAVMGGFEANQTTAVDVKAVNLRVYDGGGTQRARFDNTTGDHYVNGNKVLSSRRTGWTAATGTATRSTFDTTTATTQDIAERVKALIDDLGTTSGHGAIDA